MPLIKKYKPPIKRKICTLVKSFVFINQSEWAITNILIIKITIVKPAIRVIKFPYGFLINPPIIKAAPTETSVIATNDAKAGDKSKYSIRPCGGNGNLFKP